ncbi:MAG TPA: phosphoenolpyruvate--protein phosphotransferase [Anaerolineae bacterium]
MVAQSLQGIAASPGIAIGPIFHYRPRRVMAEHYPIDDVDGEIVRLEQALAEARRELDALSIQMRDGIGPREAAIFEAHRMFLDDPELLGRVWARLQTDRVNAEYAWQEGAQHYAAALEAIGDNHLAARAADVQDVAQRVLRILSNKTSQVAGPTEAAVIVADDLAPSDIVALDRAKAIAFCTAGGGPTSHAVILSKALGIPAIVGLGDAVRHGPEGVRAIVDGANGTLLIDPDEATIAEYRQRAEAFRQMRDSAFGVADQQAVTTDGVHVEVMANIGSVEEAAAALASGAEGVGLLRTEFLYLDRDNPPDEDEQTAIYRAVFEMMGQRPVVVRTLDVGGDKPVSYLNMLVELNPFLGLRGVRLTLARPDLFRTQLCALLRSGEGHNLRIVFPMVATVEDVIAARRYVDEARASLDARGLRYARQCQVGIMVEVPSAAVIADTLAEVVDFFSIGTNDLAQYTLAADRTNAAVSPMADAFHPAVLRLIGMVIEAAHARGRRVGLCGELAGEPLAAPVLLGLGLDEFSMGLRSIPLVKQAIRRFSTEQAGSIARRALSLRTASEVRAYLTSVASQVGDRPNESR